MDPNRKIWNERYKLLHQALNQPGGYPVAKDPFLCQHAMVHEAEMSESGLYSFADEVWRDAGDATIRCVPPNFEHSIAWLFWHIACIEDMTMNVLLAGKPQTFHQGDWLNKLNITVRHAGNVVMDGSEVSQLGNTIDLDALKTYRLAVGRSTRDVVAVLPPDNINQKVDGVRLQQLLDDGSVPLDAVDLIEYWGNLTLAGLLLMPPTRHCLVHLNEALKVKRKCP